MSALHAIFDLGAGVYDEKLQDETWELRVSMEHVARAKHLLHLVRGIAGAEPVVRAATVAMQRQSVPPSRAAVPLLAAGEADIVTTERDEAPAAVEPVPLAADGEHTPVHGAEAAEHGDVPAVSEDQQGDLMEVLDVDDDAVLHVAADGEEDLQQDAHSDLREDPHVSAVFRALCERAPRFFNHALAAASGWWQKKDTEYGDRDLKKRRFERSVHVGLTWGLWLQVAPSGSAQKLYVKRPPAEIPEFKRCVACKLITQGVSVKAFALSAADDKIRHRSLERLVSTYLAEPSGTMVPLPQPAPEASAASATVHAALARCSPFLAAARDAASKRTAHQAGLSSAGGPVSKAAPRPSGERRPRSQSAAARPLPEFLTFPERVNFVPDLTTEDVTSFFATRGDMDITGVEILSLTAHRVHTLLGMPPVFTVDSNVASNTTTGQVYQVKLRLHRTQPESPEARGEWLLYPMRGATLHGACTCPARVPCKHEAAVLHALIQGPHILGTKEEGVPQNVHDTAVEMALGGALMRTTLTERARNHVASGVSCPPDMAPLLRAGYVSPNFPWTPKGHTFTRRQGGTWALTQVGG